MERNSGQTCYFLTSLLPICVSLLWSGWNTRHHFQIFLLLHGVTSAATATLYDSGNSSYWNTKFDHHLFLSLQEFYLNKDKLKLKYHISNLMMKRDLETKKKCMDFFYNVQKLIPNICQVSSCFKVWLMLLLAPLNRLKSLVSHVREKTNFLEWGVVETFSHETQK